MSDALTDIARDQIRAEASMRMWLALASFAEGPTDESRRAAVALAKEVDSVQRGYWSRGTKHPGIIEERLENLEKRDCGTWALLILQVFEFDRERAERLHAKSPLRESLIGAIEIRNGTISIEGPAAAAITHQISQQGIGERRTLLVSLPTQAATGFKVL